METRRVFTDDQKRTFGGRVLKLVAMFNIPLVRANPSIMYMLLCPGWGVYTHNFLKGCRKISAGCLRCFGCKIGCKNSGRDGSEQCDNWRATTDGHRWTGGSKFCESSYRGLLWTLETCHRRGIFVTHVLNSNGDCFYERHDRRIMKMVLLLVDMYPDQNFMILTKRPELMKQIIEEVLGNRRRPNLILGVSTEDQECADYRIPILLSIKSAGKYFISAAPLIGPVVLKNEWLSVLDWIAVSGEFGGDSSTLRRMHPDWARGLRDQAAQFNIPFMFTCWGCQYKPKGISLYNIFALQVEAGLNDRVKLGGDILDGERHMNGIRFGVGEIRGNK